MSQHSYVESIEILDIELEAPEAAACLAQLGMGLTLVAPSLIAQMELSNPSIQILPMPQLQALPQGQAARPIPQVRREVV